MVSYAMTVQSMSEWRQQYAEHQVHHVNLLVSMQHWSMHQLRTGLDGFQDAAGKAHSQESAHEYMRRLRMEMVVCRWMRVGREWEEGVCMMSKASEAHRGYALGQGLHKWRTGCSSWPTRGVADGVVHAEERTKRCVLEQWIEMRREHSHASSAMMRAVEYATWIESEHCARGMQSSIIVLCENARVHRETRQQMEHWREPE